MNDELPSGWTHVSPDDVATTEKHSLAIGPFGSNLKVDDYRTDGVPLVFVRHIRAARFDDEGPFVTAEKAAELSAHTVRPGDVLVTKMGEPPGDSTIYPEGRPIGIITADCIKWSIDSRIGLARFFDYALHTLDVRRQIAGITQGVAQRKISLERFKSIRVPGAPLAEQVRIVDALDSLCSRLDAAVATLEAAQAKLKAYRASVLKAAVEGRLVPTEASLARAEKRDYEPADVLLKRILVERRRRWEEAELAKLQAAGKTPKDDRWKTKYEEPKAPDTAGLPKLPEGWCSVRLDSVTDIQLGQQRAPQHTSSDDPLPYMRAANITWDGLDISDVKTMGFPNPERYRLRAGDVLLSEASGSPMEAGKPAIWRDEIPGACYQKTLLRVRAVDASSLLPEFLRLVFLRDCVTGKFARLAPGVGIVHLTAERMLVWPIPLPPIAEQRRIVEEVERLESVEHALKVSVAQEVRRIGRLRQAVLKWAFEGKLVGQDPNDEPADKLLARIRAERAGTTQPKRTRRAKAAE